MPDLFSLFPFLLLSGGALTIPLANTLVPARYRAVTLPMVLGIALGAFAFYLRGLPYSFSLAPLPLPLGIQFIPALVLRWEIDFISLLPFGVVLVGWLARALLDRDANESGNANEWLWLVTFGPLVTADNLVTLIVGWVFADFCTLIYFALRESATTARRHFFTNQIGALALMLVMILTSADALDWNANKLILGDLAGTVALVAIGMRLNLFPFHLGLPFNLWLKPNRPLWSLLVPGVMTLALLARLVRWLPTEFAYAPWLYGWVILSLAFAGIQAWRDNDPDTALVWAWQAMLAPAFAIPLYVRDETRAPLLAAFIVSTFALFMFEGARRIEVAYRRIGANKILWAWGVLMLAGAPLTVAFFARVQLSAQAWSTNASVFLGVSALALALTLTPLAANFFAFAPSDKSRPGIREGIALGVLVLFALATGFTPYSLLGAFDARIAASASAAYALLIRTSEPTYFVIVLATVIVPVALAFYLASRWRAFREQWGVVLSRLLSPLLFSEWLAFFANAAEQISKLGRMIYALLEHYPLGWILFAAMGIALGITLIR